MEGLYKSKGKFGLDAKLKRKELNKVYSRSKRDEILAVRRKMSSGTRDLLSKLPPEAVVV